MFVSRETVDTYLDEVKSSIRAGRYTIAPRVKNEQIETDFVIGEKRKEEILLSLQTEDFSCILHNEHAGYEHELLYVFGKTVKLLERFGSGERDVLLYIKFNKLVNRYIIVISFHEQRYVLPHPFKKAASHDGGKYHDRDR